MPFKAKAKSRHRIPAQKYRVTNLLEYEATLKQHGNLLIWFSEDAIAQWRAESRTTPGSQAVYSPLAILTGLSLRAVLHTALRQAIELLREALVAVDDGTLRGMRNRAILLLGFAAALRRSEIVDLNSEDLKFDERGLTLHIGKSKTDQEAQRHAVAVPFGPYPAVCAVVAVRHWLDATQIDGKPGPLFRSFALPRGRTARLVVQNRRLPPGDIARIVQKAVTAAGLEGDFAAHSLRAGFITSAAVRGVTEANRQRVSRHKSTELLRGYVRHATRFDEAPLAEIFRVGQHSARKQREMECRDGFSP